MYANMYCPRKTLFSLPAKDGLVRSLQVLNAARIYIALFSYKLNINASTLLSLTARLKFSFFTSDKSSAVSC